MTWPGWPRPSVSPADRVTASPVVLDVDTGADDAGALLLAATSTDLELLAVVATWGNDDVETVVDRTIAVLDGCGRNDVPVHRGAAAPSGPGPELRPATAMVEAPAVDAFPPASRPAHGRSGAEAIAEQARSRPGEVVLVALAPLTTVAAALAIEPALPRLLRGLVVMGGAVAVGGNATAAAETNVARDPQAAAAVVSAFGASAPQPPRLVPLDVTLAAALTRAELDALGASSLPGAIVVHNVWQAVWPSGEWKTGRRDQWPAHDLLATWCVGQPDVCGWELLPLQVDVAGGAAWAATVADRRVARVRGVADDVARVEAVVGAKLSRWLVATSVDAARFRRGVRDWLARV